jgi:hypothetical protein
MVTAQTGNWIGPHGPGLLPGSGIRIKVKDIERSHRRLSCGRRPPLWRYL